MDVTKKIRGGRVLTTRQRTYLANPLNGMVSNIRDNLDHIRDIILSCFEGKKMASDEQTLIEQFININYDQFIDKICVKERQPQFKGNQDAFDEEKKKNKK